MKELEVKRNQYQKDIEVLQEQLGKIDQQIQDGEKMEVGDIVVHSGGFRRVLLFSEKRGCLAAFNEKGSMQGWSQIQKDYEKTGQNIFKDNLLNLDY